MKEISKMDLKMDKVETPIRMEIFIEANSKKIKDMVQALCYLLMVDGIGAIGKMIFSMAEEFTK